MTTLTIDCGTCVARESAACADCIVTFVCGRPPGPLAVDRQELRGLRLLSSVGLAPDLRHRGVHEGAG